MYVVVVQKFTFAISSPDEFLSILVINFVCAAVLFFQETGPGRFTSS